MIAAVLIVLFRSRNFVLYEDANAASAFYDSKKEITFAIRIGNTMPRSVRCYSGQTNLVTEPCNEFVRDVEFLHQEEVYVTFRNAREIAPEVRIDLAHRHKVRSIRSAPALCRVRLERFFVDVCAPAGSFGQDQLAVFHHHFFGDEVVNPRHVIGLEFHDPEIRDRRAKMRADQAGEVAVEIMRRAIDVERVGDRRDPHAFPQPVPRYVDNRDIDCLFLEERTELLDAVDRLERGDRRRGRAADRGEAGRVVQVDLDPAHVERLDRLGDALVAFDVLAEIQIDMQPHLRAGAVAKRRELVRDGEDQFVVDVLVEHRRVRLKARRRHAWLAAVEQQGIGLERLEAVLHRFMAERAHIMQAADRGRAEFFLEQRRVGNAEAAAMRPVKRDALAERPAEQRADRHAQGLGLDVETGIFDGSDRLIIEPARGELRQRAQRRADLADGARVLTHQHRREAADDVAGAPDAEPFVELGPADNAFVGRYFQVGQRAPAAVGVEILDLGNFHAATPAAYNSAYTVSITLSGSSVMSCHRGMRSSRPATSSVTAS